MVHETAIVLARVRLTADEVSPVVNSLIGFLTVETVLVWHDIEHLALFMQRKGKFFGQKGLHKLLEIALLENRVQGNRYQPLIQPIVEALRTQHPTFKLIEKSLLRKAVATCYSASGVRAGFKHLAQLHLIADPVCVTYLRAEFQEYLNEHFDADLYRTLLWHEALTYDEYSYFAQWVQEVGQTSNRGFIGFQNGQPQFHDYTFLDFALLLYEKEIPFDAPALSLLSDLPVFERWLIQPDKFDYKLFEVNWLTALMNRKAFFTRLRAIPSLCQAVKRSLESEFNPAIYALYHKYFQKETVDIQEAGL